MDISIVPVSEGTGDPLYFFANAPTAAMLAAGLGHPVYAMAPIEVEAAARAAPTASRTGAVYGAALAGRRPAGPIHLVGHCATGIVALETARWLRRQGRQVGLLALLDTMHPLAYARQLPPLAGLMDRDLAAHASVVAAAGELDPDWQRRAVEADRALAHLRPAVRAAIDEDLRRHGLISPVMRQELIGRQEAFLYQSLVAWLHRPEPYDGDLTFIYNDLGLDRTGFGREGLLRSAALWRDCVRGRFDALVVDGSTLAGPHVDLPAAPEVVALVADRLLH